MFVSDRTRMEIGHIKVRSCPQRWSFRSSTSVWGHIRCFQWDWEGVPPGPSIVRAGSDVCRGSAVSFHRRINRTAIFLNRHLFFGRMVIPAEQTDIICPCRDELGPGEKTSWGNRLNLVRLPFTDQYCCCRRCLCGAGHGGFSLIHLWVLLVLAALQHRPTAASIFPDASACLSCKLLLIALSYV